MFKNKKGNKTKETNVKSRRNKKKKPKSERKDKIIKWVVFTLIYAIFLMWVSGMILHYYPDPVNVGAGQYFDIYIGLLILGGSVFFIFASILINKLRKR